MSAEHDRLKEYVEARRDYEEVSRCEKIAKARLDMAEEALGMFMAHCSIKSTAAYEDLGKVTMITPALRYINVDPGSKEEFFDFVRSQDEGELIKETIHPSSLRAFAVRTLKEGTPFPEYVDFKLKLKVRYYPNK